MQTEYTNVIGNQHFHLFILHYPSLSWNVSLGVDLPVRSISTHLEFFGLGFSFMTIKSELY
jgi:hypothetical protein